ncbi:DnaJ C-terminal domain-containing protein [Nocardia salmonicida]|uniref:DnaJ C-terminal domain-containing protein n=1 Tax=Nocardia TaxID=1817 RepID=UPI0026583074|nr:DnaJ C-terminal domain-containing protein [Nocardia sp. PE-7]WKG09472.1 DnaJ C-terminal domain-containing protein [Nocardia sp. PE-7]
MERSRSVLTLIAGVFLLGIGVFALIHEVDDIDEVMCGERVMKSSQRCSASKADARLGAGKTYEAMRREQIANSNSFYNVLGVGAAVVGATMIGVGGYRLRPGQRAGTSATNPAGNPPPWNPSSAPPSPPGFTPPRGARGQDALVRVELTLAECAAGAVKPVTVDTVIACVSCLGGGFTAAGPCVHCGASGRVGARRTIQARIPPGIAADQRLRLPGQAEAGSGGGENGDLYLEIVVRPDPAFRRDGADLHTAARISSQHAATGGPLTIQTLIDGTTTVQIASNTQPGNVITIFGYGMPRPGDQRRGDLYIHIV